MSIPFTQYVPPNGMQVPVLFDASEEIERKAHELIAAGYSFGVEALSTGIISITCSIDDEDIAIQLSQNGPDILERVDAMVNDAYE